MISIHWVKFVFFYVTLCPLPFQWFNVTGEHYWKFVLNSPRLHQENGHIGHVCEQLRPILTGNYNGSKNTGLLPRRPVFGDFFFLCELTLFSLCICMYSCSINVSSQLQLVLTDGRPRQSISVQDFFLLRGVFSCHSCSWCLSQGGMLGLYK